jgi:hypothetical protein
MRRFALFRTIGKASMNSACKIKMSYRRNTAILSSLGGCLLSLSDLLVDPGHDPPRPVGHFAGQAGLCAQVQPS